MVVPRPAANPNEAAARADAAAPEPARDDGGAESDAQMAAARDDGGSGSDAEMVAARDDGGSESDAQMAAAARGGSETEDMRDTEDILPPVPSDS